MPNESTEQPAAPFEPRLRRGDRVGAHTVSRFLEVGPLGERYTALYGSTNHLVCLTVPSPGEEDPGFGPYAELCAAASRCPCVMHQFAGGVDDGTPWLRSELSSGAPEWTLASPLDPDEVPVPEDDEESDASDEKQYLTVPTLAVLLRASGEELADRDRDQLLGDVLEGLRDLHALGMASGHLAPDQIDLDRFARSRGPVARIRFFGPIDPSTGYEPATDLRMAGALFRALSSPGGRAPTRADSALAEFAGRLEAGGFASAQEALDAYDAMLRARGASRTVHREPDAPPPKPKNPAPDPRGSSHNGAHRRRRHHRHAPRQQMSRLAAFAAGSEAAGRAVLFFRIAVVLLFIIALGFGVYFLLEWMDEKERYENRDFSGTLSAFTAVTRIPLVDPASEAAAEAAAAAADEFAAARRELADPGAEGAAARMAAEIPALRERADDDPQAAGLLGEALLLGFGAERDLPEALRLLEAARAARIPRAVMRLGDLFSSRLPAPEGVPKARIERDSLAFSFYLEATRIENAPRDLVMASADRAVAVLRRQRTSTGFPREASEWVHAAAASGHAPSMMLLSVPSPFTEPRESLKWLRRLTDSQLPDDVLGWAETRRAECYAEGRGGTQKSDASARKWYERAVEHGNPVAMRALADFCEQGRGPKGTAPDPERAAELRRKADSAGPEPIPFPALPSL